MKFKTQYLKWLCLVLGIVAFGFMFWDPLLVLKTKLGETTYTFAQVFFKAPLIEGVKESAMNPAIGGFIGFVFVLVGSFITAITSVKVTKKNKFKVFGINGLGIIVSLVGCLLIFLTPSMFGKANATGASVLDNNLTYALTVQILIAGIIGVVEAIVATVAAFLDLNKKK